MEKIKPDLNDLENSVPEFLLKNYKVFSVYHGEAVHALWDIPGFKMLAWTHNVKYLLYDPENNILLSWIEGDIYVDRDPTPEDIDESLQYYPKAEVSLGEKYDRRFSRGEKNGEN